LNASFGAVLDSLHREGEGWAATIPKARPNGRSVFDGLQVALSVRAMRAAPGASLGDGRSSVAALACATFAIFG
jgi:hypothetical protein